MGAAGWGLKGPPPGVTPHLGDQVAPTRSPTPTRNGFQQAARPILSFAFFEHRRQRTYFAPVSQTQILRAEARNSFALSTGPLGD